MINENELITLICQRKEPEIKSWLNTLKSDFSGNQLSKDLYFISIHSLLDKLLKFIYELNLDTADLQKSIIETYSKLDSFSTTEDLFGWIESICIVACNKVDASLTTYHSQLSHSVVEYINANYMNADLSLNELAKYANVSPSYLSAMFKKAEGISIIDCITNIRIDNACTLLQTTSLTLKEISQKCGYANQYYFSTAFKKKIGMSPSAYRDNASSL
jgi:two-component system response regulator YesN